MDNWREGMGPGSLERAALAGFTGDNAACQCELREGHRMFAEMGAVARAEQVAWELGT